MDKSKFKSFGGDIDPVVTRQLYKELGYLLGNELVEPDPPVPSLVNYTPGKLLDVPYYSQHGPGADKLRSDCGPACVKMCGDYYKPDVHISIDYIMEKITGGTDRGTYINELINVYKNLYNVELERHNNMTLGQLKTIIDQGFPVTCLINYNYDAIRMDRNFRGGHYVVVVGYDYVMYNGKMFLRFIIHDPDFYGPDTVMQGAFMPIAAPHFMKMWGKCHENYKGNPDNMGLVALGVSEEERVLEHVIKDAYYEDKAVYTND